MQIGLETILVLVRFSNGYDHLKIGPVIEWSWTFKNLTQICPDFECLVFERSL
jgi:hypothetical protein